jgi:hypothetical protein
MALLDSVREGSFHWYLFYLIPPRFKNYARLPFPKDLLTAVSGHSCEIRLETWKCSHPTNRGTHERCPPYGLISVEGPAHD